MSKLLWIWSRTVPPRVTMRRWRRWPSGAEVRNRSWKQAGGKRTRIRYHSKPDQMEIANAIVLSPWLPRPTPPSCRRRGASPAGRACPGDKSISHRYAMFARAGRRRLHHQRLFARRRLRRHAGLPARRSGPASRRTGRPRVRNRGPRPARAAARRRPAGRRQFRDDDAAHVRHPRRPPDARRPSAATVALAAARCSASSSR